MPVRFETLDGRPPQEAGIVDAGLDAIEAYHIDHDAQTMARYAEMAHRYGVLVSGGSDYHGDESHGAPAPGTVSLPQGEYDRLVLHWRRGPTPGAN